MEKRKKKKKKMEKMEQNEKERERVSWRGLESVVGARFSFGSFYESDRIDY